jgi:hypothetical protein
MAQGSLGPSELEQDEDKRIHCIEPQVACGQRRSQTGRYFWRAQYRGWRMAPALYPERERERDKGLTEVSELHYRPIADAAGFGRAHLNISERRDIQVAPSAGTRVNESSYLATNGQHAEEDFQARPIENLQISSKRTQLKESR